jgi:DNA-binding GntR family transcriptional regulator
MPALPVSIDQDHVLIPAQRAVTEASPPYVRIAADLRAAITCGALRPGDPLPTVADLAKRYGVAPSTAHRAVSDLAATGAVQAASGRRTIVRP